MEKVRNFISIIFIIGVTYLVSCDNNNLTSPNVISIPSNNVNAESCWDNYTGNCQGLQMCVHIKKNGVERKACDGFLEITGYTCNYEYYYCKIPLSETMICDEYGEEMGPKVPYGDYIYKVCCNLGGGQLNVNIPNTSPLIINIDAQCDININGNNN